MNKDILIMNGIVLFYIIQRISEVLISQSNEVWLKEHCNAVEVNPKESLFMKLFHASWFVALLTEINIRQTFHNDSISLVIYFILGLCLVIRFHTIEKLKRFWTIKVFQMKNQRIETEGIYKYMRHPNYFVVMVELMMIPLLFKAYFTMIIYSLLNFMVLKRRIKLEESTLMNHSDYQNLFVNKKRILPFILSLFLCLSVQVHAAELNYHFKNYDDAKKATAFIKFESTSTKLGFITTSFDGYAKDIKITYQLNNDKLSQLSVTIPVKSLDTDVSGRDEKMHNQILNAEQFSSLLISSDETITLVPGEHVANMVFTIKDKKISKAVKFKVARTEDNKFAITGGTQLGLTEIGLPDPSIAIAKVRDTFDLAFSIVI